MQIRYPVTLLAIILIPTLALAATQDSFTQALINVSGLIKILTGIAFSLAFLGFFWGMFKYLGTNSEQEKKDAISIMATSIAIIFIMVSVWGLVALLKSTIGADDGVDKFRPPKTTPLI